MATALIFCRPRGAQGFGHVGWAYELPDGKFVGGSVENPPGTPVTPPHAMGMWTRLTDDPYEVFRKGPLGRHPRYDEYKVVEVVQPNPRAAQKATEWVGEQPYHVFGRNCMDSTFDVLVAFGASHLPKPQDNWAPNDWFAKIQDVAKRL